MLSNKSWVLQPCPPTDSTLRSIRHMFCRSCNVLSYAIPNIRPTNTAHTFSHNVSIWCKHAPPSVPRHALFATRVGCSHNVFRGQISMYGSECVMNLLWFTFVLIGKCCDAAMIVLWFYKRNTKLYVRFAMTEYYYDMSLRRLVTFVSWNYYDCIMILLRFAMLNCNVSDWQSASTSSS